MTIEQVEATLDAFFKNDNLKVLFFKGPWGSGKSFFIRTYLSKLKSFVPAYQYSVSLFGLENLQEVREALNASLEFRPTSDGKKGVLIAKSVGGVAKALDAFKKLPDVCGIPVGNIGSIGSSVFWLVAKNQSSVVVFDDLERAKLAPHNILGLASNLAENTKAKVIIIFNEDQLDKKELLKVNEYREKVVDIEILFKPTVTELVDHYLVEKQIRQPIIELMNGLDSRNIRLLNKINIHLEQFKQLAATSNIKLSSDELVRAAKVTCLRYLSKKQLTPEKVAQGSFGVYLKKEEQSEEDIQLADLARKISIFPPYPLDALAFELIQNGYCSPEFKLKYLDKYKDNKFRDEFNSDLMKAYARYSDNFIATAEDVYADMETFLDKYSGQFLMENFIGHLKFLESIGYSKSFDDWKEKQLIAVKQFKKHQDRLKAAQLLLPSKPVQII